MAITAAFAAPPAQPTANTFDIESLRIPHQKFVLSNGLTVLVHTDPSTPIVAVNLWYHVGSSAERRGRTGFAHLFEHFFFNGSEHHKGGFREAMDDLGANNRNGTTNPDRTNFFEDVPLSGLERTLFLEADRMGFLAANLSQEMLERERGVVQNEKRQGENQPYGRVFDRVFAAMYPYSHPYSWSTIGSMEDLNAATLDDVKKWYETYYGPNHCVLSLAGDITPERALELARKYFGDIPPGPALPSLESWMPHLDTDIREVLEDRVPQARVLRAYHVPGWGTKDLQRLNLLSGVFAGSKSARLDRRLIYDKQLATDAAAFVADGELGSLFVLQATAKPGVDPAVIEREMDLALAELLDKGLSAAELDRARMRFYTPLARGIERLGGFGGRSDVLAESMTYGGDPHAYMQQLRWMADSSPGDLQAAGRAWLGSAIHHYTLTVVPYPKLAKAETAVDRTKVPALEAPATDIGFPQMQRATLHNGLPVLLLERHGAPLVQVALAVDAGFASDPTDKAGLASLALDLLDDGTATRDTFRIADELDALGASITTDSSLDFSNVRLKALRPTLPGALDLYADVVLRAAFPENLVELEKRSRLARIAQERVQPIAAALRIVPSLLYGSGHPYGKPGTGSGFDATVQSITRADLVAWHKQWFQPGSSTLIVTGDVNLADLMPQLERAFAVWSAGSAPKKEFSRAPEASVAGARGKLFLVDKPDAPQSVIVAAHLSEPGGHAEDLAMEVLMRLFGGMSTSRLNRNLRLDKHWSYGTTAQLRDARGARPFLVIAPVQTDKTAPALQEVLREIREIAGERPVRGEEFHNIQRGVVARLPGRFETLNALEDAAGDLVAFGYPVSFFADYARNVQALGEADLATAAARFIKPQEVVWIVIGDRKRVEAELRALKIAEVEILEAK